MAKAKLSIQIWSDVTCPWCLIAMLQLESALDQLRDEIEAEISFLPFELNPDLPEEGLDWKEAYRRKYGHDPVSEGASEAQQVASQLGYDMRYCGSGQAPARRTWNTHNAHKLLRWVLDTQGAGAQKRLKRALFDANFQGRRNMTDPESLVQIAREAGVAVDGAMTAVADADLSRMIREEEAQAADDNIVSVPVVVIEGRVPIPGAQEPDVYIAFLRRYVQRFCT